MMMRGPLQPGTASLQLYRPWRQPERRIDKITVVTSFTAGSGMTIMDISVKD